MIRIEHLEKYYNKGKKQEQHVLNDISLSFEDTGLICILGESGSGKTTLLNTIGGLDDFSGGTLTVGEDSLSGYDAKMIEKIRNDQFGYIFQNYYLLSEYTVEYNIKLALARYELSESEENQRVDQVLQMLGMEKYKHKQVSKLSGGQQQRVSIARALVKTPHIILADEPTGNLDEENTLRTMSILKSLSKDCLVLLVTHERRIAHFFADRIIEIADGTIIRDEQNTASFYQRSDDSNLYLQGLEHTSLEESHMQFNLYHEREELPPDIRLNLVWKNGKLYLQNLKDYDILLEGEENGFQIIDDAPPTLDLDTVEAISYDLPNLEAAGSASLPLAAALHMAMTNISMMGKKQHFIRVILLAAAVMLSVTLAQFMNTVSIDTDTITSTDSHYVQVNFTNVSVFHTEEQLQVFSFAQTYLDAENTFYVPTVNLYLIGQGFEQLENIRQPLPKYCYASLSNLSEKDLLYGRMPEKRTEVVADLRVIEALLDSGGVLSSQLDSPEDYLSALLKTSVSSAKLEIVGICDTGEPDIYCGQNVLLSFSSSGYRIASDTELMAEDPDSYGDVSLGDTEILIREGLYSSLALDSRDTYTLGDDKTHVYSIAGTIPDSLGVDYVLSEAGCRNVRDLMIYENRTCMVYSDDITSTEDSLNDSLRAAAKESMKNFSLELSVPFETEIAEYQAANPGDFHATYLIAAAIAILSLLLIYFTIKSNALSRIEELTVYRLLGIKKSSILKSYVLEMMLLSSMTSLPAVLLTSMVIWFIGGIPSLEIGLLFPWWSVLALLLLLYVIHALVSVLPVNKVLSQPPAALAIKE